MCFPLPLLGQYVLCSICAAYVNLGLQRKPLTASLGGGAVDDKVRGLYRTLGSCWYTMIRNHSPNVEYSYAGTIDFSTSSVVRRGKHLPTKSNISRIVLDRRFGWVKGEWVGVHRQVRVSWT